MKWYEDEANFPCLVLDYDHFYHVADHYYKGGIRMSSDELIDYPENLTFIATIDKLLEPFPELKV
jgi:hypothetical protein